MAVLKTLKESSKLCKLSVFLLVDCKTPHTVELNLYILEITIERERPFITKINYVGVLVSFSKIFHCTSLSYKLNT